MVALRGCFLFFFAAFHSFLGPVTLTVEVKTKGNFFHIMYWVTIIHQFGGHYSCIRLPGVVGGTSLISMLRLSIICCETSSLGCFSTIVLIGAGVSSRSFVAASVR